MFPTSMTVAMLDVTAFFVACYHLSSGAYHPQRSADMVDPMHCTFTEAYENNHAPCLYVCRDKSENVNSV